MSRIVTITLNTAIDHIILVPQFSVGNIFRAKQNWFFPSGKGINVSRTIGELGIETLALGFVGNSQNYRFKGLNPNFIEMILTNVEGDTRTNITILDETNHGRTHIQNQGYTVRKDDFRKLKSNIHERIKSGDIVVISGSLPPGISSNSYIEIIQICKLRGAQVIFDSSGEAFRNGVSAQPYMVKPNIHELEMYAHKNLRNNECEIITAARELTEKKGIEVVVVSRGADGFLVLRAGSRTFWKVFLDVSSQPKSGNNGVGSGDALVGGWAIGLLKKMSFTEIMRLSISCASANLYTLAPGGCDKTTVYELMSRVEIQEFQLDLSS